MTAEFETPGFSAGRFSLSDQSESRSGRAGDDLVPARSLGLIDTLVRPLQQGFGRIIAPRGRGYADRDGDVQMRVAAHDAEGGGADVPPDTLGDAMGLPASCRA